MRKRTKRRRGIPIPTLCEAHGRDNDREYGHGALPIIGFKEGPSKRYLEWLKVKNFLEELSSNEHSWIGQVTTGEWPMEPMLDRFARFIQSADWPTTTSHDWVPVAPGFPARP
jgi:hypothetical protein